MATIAPDAQTLEGVMTTKRAERLAQMNLIEMSVKDMLVTIGEDVNREGLLNTPTRVARFYLDFLAAEEFQFTSFVNDGSSEMIIQSDIEFHSLCEHHMLPFYGSAAVAYIPNGKIVGLSKLARCVDHYSRRLQNQERITKQVADRLQSELAPIGVAVVLKARHFCMEMRGVRKRGAYTTTSCLLGAFKDDAAARAEFLLLANNLKV